MRGISVDIHKVTLVDNVAAWNITNISEANINAIDTIIDLHEEIEILGGKLEFDRVVDVDTDTPVLRLRGGLGQLDISGSNTPAGAAVIKLINL